MIRKRVNEALQYREQDKDASMANAVEDQTYLNDERFDAITEKVIAFMDKTNPEEWSPPLWSLFKQLWQDRKTKKRVENRTPSHMTMEELQSLMSSDDA